MDEQKDIPTINKNTQLEKNDNIIDTNKNIINSKEDKKYSIKKIIDNAKSLIEIQPNDARNELNNIFFY